MLEIPVKLIVKAPNQQVEDQTIHCNMSWTIKRLKGYLSEVHPSKPNTEDQRLIYYGQLLSDSVTLKDVLTKYEAGEETHTVHLVCMPSKETLKMQARKLAEEKSKRAKEGVNPNGGGASTSGQRPVSNETQTIPEGNPDFMRSAEGNYFQSAYQNWMAGVPTQDPAANNYIQQWNWMQQAYANYYMNQYLNMVARQNALGIREGTRQDEDVRNPVPQDRNVEEDDHHNHINRDWLDCLYTMSRFVVLLSIVYFYSSPMRFLIVSSLGLALYLYQMGFFRLHQFLDENEGVNNNPRVNNNARANNNARVNNNNVIQQENAARAERLEREEQVIPAQPNPAPEPEVEPNPNPDPNPGPNPNQNQEPIQNQNPNPNPNPNQNQNQNQNRNRNGNTNQNGQRRVDTPDHPSFIARTWIFVTTFFSSMIPETDNPM